MPTQPTPTPPAIEALFDQYFNHTITPEGMAQLEAWLAESPANAQILARAGLAHGLTREVVKQKMQANLRPRVLHFAAPALLAASVLLAVGLGVYWMEQRVHVEAPVVAMGEVVDEIKLLGADGTTKSNEKWADIGVVSDGAPPIPVASPAPAKPVPIGGERGRITVVSGVRNGYIPGAGYKESKHAVLRQNYVSRDGDGVSDKRYVGAVRIEELSGKLNLNTASPEVLKGLSNSQGAFLDYSNKDLEAAGRIIAPSIGEPQVDDAWLVPLPSAPLSRDQYAHIWDNKFTSPLIQPLSTFSVDVDTAAYANMRRFISEGQLPPPDAVRIEEMLNYFSYDYAPPAVLKPGEAIGEQAPFAAHTEVCACPWNPAHKLVRIGLKGAEVDMSKRPQAHLTFLLDVSGSMNEADKLPLAKQALIRLLAQLRADDHVSLVVYAGSSGCVLENAPCSEKAQILGAIDRLAAGGSTAGAQGIHQAYELAQKHFIKEGVNRVILCTDGDFNVGTSDTGSLIRLAKEKANPANGEGVFLSTCGFGRGNLNDHMMEQIADAGNGNYAYIDSLAEAEKVFVKQAGGTLITIAKDVKLQLEFNPAKVGKYRLIGYENRVLKAEDFNDDTVDAGDIGAGHTVTALYEIEPVGANPYASVDEEIKDLERQVKAVAEFVEKNKLTPETAALQKQAIAALQARIQHLKTPAADRSVDPLTYQSERKISEQAQASGDLLTLKLRYKQPDAKAEQGTSKLLKFTLKDADTAFEKASADTRFAASVAAYGMILRGSEFKGTATLGWVEKAAGETWPQGYEANGIRTTAQADAMSDRAAQRAEFVALVRKAQALKKD